MSQRIRRFFNESERKEFVLKSRQIRAQIPELRRIHLERLRDAQTVRVCLLPCAAVMIPARAAVKESLKIDFDAATDWNVGHNLKYEERDELTPYGT